jgi:uncharacterized membrane protein
MKMHTKSFAIALAALCALMGSVGQLLFKVGSSSVKLDVWSWITNISLISGMGLYGLSAVLFIFALKYGNLSVLYPVIATSYVWVALISSKILGESLSLANWGGIALILVGVTLVVGR